MSTVPDRSIPLFVRAFAGVLILIGLAAGLAQYLAPHKVFSGLPEVLPPALALVAWEVASRSIGQAAALALGLVLADRRTLAVLFVMRAVTEAQDLAISLRTGIAPAPLAATAAIFVVVFIIPELLCARWLFLAARRA